MATTTERISLPKFAAAIGLAAEQVKDILPRERVVEMLVYLALGGNVPLAPGGYEYGTSELTQIVVAMVRNPDDPNWDR